MSTDEYVPSEEYVRESYVRAGAKWRESCEKEAEFNRFLARVRRETVEEVIQELQRTGMTDASSYIIGYRDRKFHER